MDSSSQTHATMDSSSINVSHGQQAYQEKWTNAHIIFYMDNATRRWWHVCWSPTTSTGTIAKHLAEKYRLSGDPNQNSGISQPIQSSIESSKVSRVLEKKLDGAITNYIVKGTLSHAHVELGVHTTKCTWISSKDKTHD